ncbi:MAG: hypothetical protein WBQ32_07410 [Ignavibacteriaceae bacterium]
MTENKPNILLYGLIIGGLIGAGLTVYFSSRFISKNHKKKRERKHKFYEGLDNIFESEPGNNDIEDTSIDKETEEGIIDELFSRTN